MSSKTTEKTDTSTSDTKDNTSYIYDDKLKNDDPQTWQKLIAERTAHIQRSPVIQLTPLQPRVTHISIQGWFYKT